MKKISKFMTLLLILSLIFCMATACGDKTEPAGSGSHQEATSLSGKALQIYCGAGLSKPFGEIAQAFQDETGCEMNVIYANAAQIQTQIKTTEEGDLFIAGSSEELAPVQDYIADSKDLVKHIPVLAVQSGNPSSISGLQDLAKDGIDVVLGDAESTPIGKISNKALSNLGILENVNVVSRAATAPELITALSLAESDATIVWKENVTGSDIEIVDTPDLDQYIKTVPAASLTCSTDQETLGTFLDFLDSDSAKNIWKKYGYEVLN